MQKETIQFRLGKNPLVKEKIIILEEADGRKAVIFPMYRLKHEIEHAEVAQQGEVVELTGKWGTDKKTGQPQFLVDSVRNAKVAKEVQPQAVAATPAPMPEASTVMVSPQQKEAITLPKLKDIKAAMDANYWPGPLFDGDPYAINPEKDFEVGDKIKTFTINGKTFYTDSILVWQKDNDVIRQKYVMTPKVREQYLEQTNIQALYTIHELTDEPEPYPENHYTMPFSF